MRKEKYLHFIVPVLLLSPLSCYGQKYLKPLVTGVPRVAQDAVLKSITQKAVTEMARPAVTAAASQSAVCAALEGIDSNWMRYWKLGKVPPVTVHYGENGLAEIKPMVTPAPTEIFIEGKMFTPPTQGVSPTYHYSEGEGVDAAWFNNPSYEQMDNVARLKNLKYKVDILRSQVRSLRFYSSLRSQTEEEKIPFERILPSQKLDYLYVLLQHGEMYENEMVNLVRAVKRKYPTRQIVLATEYVWDNSQQVVFNEDKNDAALLKIVGREEEEPGALRTATTQDELYEVSDGDYDRYPFLQTVIKEKIPVIGIEPGAALVDAVAEEMAQTTGLPKEFVVSMGPALLECYYQNLGVSEGGMWLRNARWVDNIQRISQQYPGALIIVLGGAKHLSAAEFFSVPNLSLSGGKAFSIALMGQEGKDIVSPLFSGLGDREYDDFLKRAATEQKPLYYILSLKHPSEEESGTVKDVQKAKRALGADVSVIFPSRIKRWSRGK